MKKSYHRHIRALLIVGASLLIFPILVLLYLLYWDDVSYRPLESGESKKNGFLLIWEKHDVSESGLVDVYAVDIRGYPLKHLYVYFRGEKYGGGPWITDDDGRIRVDMSPSVNVRSIFVGRSVENLLDGCFIKPSISAKAGVRLLLVKVNESDISNANERSDKLGVPATRVNRFERNLLSLLGLLAVLLGFSGAAWGVHKWRARSVSSKVHQEETSATEASMAGLECAPPPPLFLRVLKWGCLSFVAGTFFLAGVAKLFEPEAFARDIRGYRLPLFGLEEFIAFTLPPLEIVCALALFWKRTREAALWILGVLTVVFLFALGQAVVRGFSVDCGCFGGILAFADAVFAAAAAGLGLSSMAIAIVRDVALLAMIAFLAWREHREWRNQE